MTTGPRNQGQQSAAGSEQVIIPTATPRHGDSHAVTLSRLLEKLVRRLNRCCGVLTPPPAAPPPLHTLFNNYQQMIFARIGRSSTGRHVAPHQETAEVCGGVWGGLELPPLSPGRIFNQC